jgi:hypothetical protein
LGNFRHQKCHGVGQPHHGIQSQGQQKQGDERTHSTSRIQRCAGRIDEKKFVKETCLSPQHAKILKMLPGVSFAYPPDAIRIEALTQHQLTAGRNAASHDTEVGLAELPCSDRLKDSQDYHFWGRMFPYCFDGRTVEQVAEGTLYHVNEVKHA